MKKSSNRQMWNYRESRMVESGREAVGEWASEGSFERIFIPVGADGSPPVIHRARVMAREASGRENVNLGGIAGVRLLSHVG